MIEWFWRKSEIIRYSWGFFSNSFFFYWNQDSIGNFIELYWYKPEHSPSAMKSNRTKTSHLVHNLKANDDESHLLQRKQHQETRLGKKLCKKLRRKAAGCGEQNREDDRGYCRGWKMDEQEGEENNQRFKTMLYCCYLDKWNGRKYKNKFRTCFVSYVCYRWLFRLFFSIYRRPK